MRCEASRACHGRVVVTLRARPGESRNMQSCKVEVVEVNLEEFRSQNFISSSLFAGVAV